MLEMYWGFQKVFREIAPIYPFVSNLLWWFFIKIMTAIPTQISLFRYVLLSHGFPLEPL
jgi:hypothetical protein